MNHIVKLGPEYNYTTIEKLLKWCENIGDENWYFLRNVQTGNFNFVFLKKEDATAFKLIFGL